MTYSEAAKSPRPKVSNKMSKNGLKLKEQPVQPGQKTLEEAFDAGQMYQEAQQLKQKALKGKKRLRVSYFIYFLIL